EERTARRARGVVDAAGAVSHAPACDAARRVARDVAGAGMPARGHGGTGDRGSGVRGIRSAPVSRLPLLQSCWIARLPSCQHVSSGIFSLDTSARSDVPSAAPGTAARGAPPLAGEREYHMTRQVTFVGVAAASLLSAAIAVAATPFGGDDT